MGINNVESASARTCLQKAIERTSKFRRSLFVAIAGLQVVCRMKQARGTVMSTGGMRYSNDVPSSGDGHGSCKSVFHLLDTRR